MKENKIEVSVYQKKKNALEAQKPEIRKKTVVNAGLLKAGKSTLFNVLAGEKLFDTDVVRATVENRRAELDGYILMDTPGLDAQDADTQEAFAGYADADLFIFVHNMQEGELNQTEVDCIEQICSLFDDREVFFQNAVLVLTHRDQVENVYQEIKERIGGQCRNILGNQFSGCFCVDSLAYGKGVAEGKELLKQDSGILELRDAIEEIVSGQSDSILQKKQFEKKKKELLAEIQEGISYLQKSMPEEDTVPVSDLQKRETEIRSISERAVRKIRERKLSLPGTGSCRFWGVTKDYKEYDSEYSAKSAGEKTVEKAIREIARVAKSQALSIVESADACINFGKVPKEMADSLLDVHEEICQCAMKSGIVIKTPFDIILRDPSPSKATWEESELKKADRELGYVRDTAAGINTGSFSRASYYMKDYMVDFDRREKWVKGLFGRESLKSVWVYRFDVKEATDDIAWEAKELVDEKIHSPASEVVGPVFYHIKKDLEKQFADLMERILAEVEHEIGISKKRGQEYQRKKAEVQNKIAALESCRDEVERM